MTANLSKYVSLNRRWTIGVSLALLVVFAAVPSFASGYVQDLVFRAFVLGILAISWNLLAGYAGQVSLGHAAFFGGGAYVSAWLTTPTAAGLPNWLGVHPVVAVLIGGIAVLVMALVVGPGMFRLHGHYFAIGTLALAAIIQLILTNMRSISGGATGYYVQNEFGIIGIYYTALVCFVAVFVATYYVTTTRLGLGMRAIKDDQSAASSLGVSPLRYKMWAFVISSFFAGISGGLYAQYTLYLNPSSTLGIDWTIDTLVIVVLGGMGTMIGPIVGTGVFMVLDNFLSTIVGELATTFEGILIILFVIFLPRGLYGYIKENMIVPRTESSQQSEESEFNRDVHD